MSRMPLHVEVGHPYEKRDGELVREEFLHHSRCRRLPQCSVAVIVDFLAMVGEIDHYCLGVAVAADDVANNAVVEKSGVVVTGYLLSPFAVEPWSARIRDVGRREHVPFRSVGIRRP
jgi:hypothetical protein